ncbi:hypothetical protein QJQ45_014850, partial [Haematococcus lacustris]
AGRTAQVLLYGLRWCGALAALELLTRCLLVNAVAKYGLLTSRLDLLRGWLPGGPSPLHFALVGFWVLVFMWLKFLVIWRFFHCLALLEGVEPPENMGRCVCNNYDIEGFWRGWHCSYNRWLVRYLYIPLGGATRRLLVIWPVFLFVALWHDLEPRLLHWGLLMPAAFCPELVVKAAAKLPLLARHRQRWWYRQVAALLASCNILALMTANLAGFVVGVEGVGPLVRQVLGQPAMAGGVLGTLFCAVQLMFAIRQREDAEKQGRPLMDTPSYSKAGPQKDECKTPIRSVDLQSSHQVSHLGRPWGPRSTALPAGCLAVQCCQLQGQL